jgi:8-oxo-dGTP pyrophosphatase MutT (NUDIX family)
LDLEIIWDLEFEIWDFNKNMRKVSLLILYDSQKRFLLQHRTPDAPLLADHWAFFGGGFKEGENSRAALLRESYEELRYTPKAPELVLVQNFSEKDVFGRLFIYIEEFLGDKSALVLKEGQGLGWFGVDELDSLKMIDRDKAIIRFIASHLKEREQALSAKEAAKTYVGGNERGYIGQ